MNFIRQLLKASPLYNHVRHSRLYGWWLKWRNPSYLRALKEDEEFYRNLFCGRRLGLVFDVGANCGDKAHVFLQLADRVVCYEPDPRFVDELRVRFRNHPQVSVIQKGISDQTGLLNLTVFGGGSAYNTMSSKQRDLLGVTQGDRSQMQVEVTTLQEEMKTYGVPDFLKVDVEGHEEAVFLGMNVMPELISFEANLPGFAEESCRVARKLEAMNADVRFTVGGSGLVPDLTFPMDRSKLESLLTRKDVPPYLEIFARR